MSEPSDSTSGERPAEPAVKVDVGPPPEPTRSWPRLVGLFAVMVALFAIGHFTGLTEHATAENLRALVESLGVWGMLIFVVLFAVGEFVHVPGLVFVLAALLAYGRVAGALVAYAGALASVSFSFLVVRRIGGQALANVRRAWIARVLDHLDARPVLTIAALRTVLFLMPALNYGLALTRVRFRDYLLGSAIGLVLPVIVLSLVFEQVLAWME